MLYQTIRISTQSRTFSPRYEKQQQIIWISDREKGNIKPQYYSTKNKAKHGYKRSYKTIEDHAMPYKTKQGHI